MLPLLVASPTRRSERVLDFFNARGLFRQFGFGGEILILDLDNVGAQRASVICDGCHTGLGLEGFQGVIGLVQTGADLIGLATDEVECCGGPMTSKCLTK